jgi:hypothetical protein
LSALRNRACFRFRFRRKTNRRTAQKDCSKGFPEMMDAIFIRSMHGVADSCSLNGGFQLDVANTRSAFAEYLPPTGAPGLRQPGRRRKASSSKPARGNGRGMLRGVDLRPKHFHHLQAKAALFFLPSGFERRACGEYSAAHQWQGWVLRQAPKEKSRPAVHGPYFSGPLTTLTRWRQDQSSARSPTNFSRNSETRRFQCLVTR